MPDITNLSVNDMIVQNNLRADIPELFPDEYEKALCAIIVLMYVPEIGGQKLNIQQIAEKTGYTHRTLSERIYRWRKAGIWQEVIMTLVGTMKADIQVANLSVLSHYPQVVGEVLKIIVDPKVSPRTRLEAATLYMDKLLPKAEAMEEEGQDAIEGFISKHSAFTPKTPVIEDAEVIDAIITEVKPIVES